MIAPSLFPPTDEERTMKKTTLSLATTLVALALAGCASSVKLDDKAPVSDRSVGAGGAGGGAGANANAAQSRVVPVDANAAQAAAASNLPRLVYFDFDSYVVKDEFRPVIEGHARVLTADAKKRLMIEGHTDERGGREYNLALGQKRAEAVARSLALLGAKESQIESVSFGEERPAAQGSDEAAWAKNRRAELNQR
jgi:peptidoglycan-associated lipoprotein